MFERCEGMEEDFLKNRIMGTHNQVIPSSLPSFFHYPHIADYQKCKDEQERQGLTELHSSKSRSWTSASLSLPVQILFKPRLLQEVFMAITHKPLLWKLSLIIPHVAEYYNPGLPCKVAHVVPYIREPGWVRKWELKSSLHFPCQAVHPCCIYFRRPLSPFPN